MDSLSKIEHQAKQLIQVDKIPETPLDRVSANTREFLKGQFCVDVHTHFFDSKCINTSYMVIRLLKDFFNLRGYRGNSSEEQEIMIEQAYDRAHMYTDDWNERLSDFMREKEDHRDGKLSVLSILTRKSEMRKVYEYYIDKSSLAEYFDLDKHQVLTTALMMDFKVGWDLDVGKSITEQIYELKELAKEKPVLPFLFCDPRRAEFTNEENLYHAFNTAFANENSFFGVKIYPCLGYDPSDYRLWPIYEICEAKNIPVLSHCGGNTVSTPKRKITVFEGTKEKPIEGKNRKEVAYQLNDPVRWKKVLERYKGLKLNIAHFGSDATWSSTNPVEANIDPQQRKETIIELMDTHPNVYSDFSYTITNEVASRNFLHRLKADPQLLQKRSMFGSDFWVVYNEGGLEENQKKFLDMIGDKGLQKMLCLTNPMQYLFGSSWKKELEEGDSLVV